MTTTATSEKHAFQAEIKQLLNILVHSLYKERDIFLRELVSNASDALNKIQFEMLTNPDVLDPEAELKIHLLPDKDQKTLRIVDTGIGLTRDEMIDNLGVIAHSGAASFLERVKAQDGKATADLIGQFGVGFYSVFMVAEKVEVISRSYLPDAEPCKWVSGGDDDFEILPAEKEERGTEIIVYLRDDAEDFADEYRLRQIIKRHSDYVAFPIYLGEPKMPEATEDEDGEDDAEAVKESEPLTPINQQQAIWRRPVSEVEDSDYENYYRMLTMDFEPPAMNIHTHGDAPIQYYALLYIPKQAERNMFSLRKEPGLKLYTRKVLIDEYFTDLLPEYLQFVQGVVDSEDFPLNVSRETVQNNPQVAKLKQVLTRRILTDLGRLAKNEDEEKQKQFEEIWHEFGVYLKHGVVADFSDRKKLLPLLRFYSSKSDAEDKLISLDEYVENMAEGQEDIYYMIADNRSAATHSPHLDPFRARGIDVLYFTDTVDGFLATSLPDYEDHKLVSVDAANLDLDGVGKLSEEADAEEEAVPEVEMESLLSYIKGILGEKVENVRVSKVLSTGSPARLVTPEGAMNRHTQRVYQMLDKEFDTAPRILEINARHPIVRNLSERLEKGLRDDFLEESVQVLYENAMLADGIHPNPADLVPRIQALMERATKLNESGE